ncbi:G patch domain and ankyrin repeat-containing protein 1 homolog isoform X1 [Leptopilina boulardi]|uniref:G patch domain and ankyrin repeat-containing protein 1 homolog isoform X1 n=1 Tax=Leptopilina boulardi TaxID=63433 RepID=UPI0021F57493|nr:G patch domain and ankyrin repeat-containing protein 1 homolog isoform X1 [Leptopilina boulardi]
MSFNPNNIIGVDRPLKIFVKESNNIEELPAKKIISKLGFQGLEAKIAYEEAINFPNEKSQQNNQTKKIVRGKRKLIENTTSANVSVNLIFKAIESKDISFLKTNLHTNNINITDAYGWTPLMSAAYSGNLEIVQLFLKLGAKKNIKDKSGLTAAALAIKNKFTNIVKLLEERDNKLKNISSKNPTVINKHKKIEKINFYCNVCNSNFENVTQLEHESSIVHIFNMKPKISGAHYIVPKGNKGYQMLINSGWDEEHGLGPSGEGRKYPVKTILKQDRKGLGLEEKKNNIPKVTHFKPGDRRAIKTKRRAPNERTLKKWERDNHLQREARRDKALRKALS